MTTKKLSVIKRNVDPDLVHLLETALKQAKAGEIKGAVVLINRYGDEYQHAAAGDMKMSEVVNAFESWKFDQHMMAYKEYRK